MTRRMTMFKYGERVRCKECGKIYPDTENVPDICYKCGARIIYHGFLYDRTDQDYTEKVIAKRTLFGWKIREDTENELN
jgi:rRNA maturation endonuclease Nob1